MIKPLKDAPLFCEIEHNQLVIRIGISTLAVALKEDEANKYLPEDDVPRIKRIDDLVFAKDVVYSMNDEDEGGHTPLMKFLDEMMQDAVNLGSQGVEFDIPSSP